MPETAPVLRRLGLWSASAIVVANMIGTGVFSTLSYQVHALPDERAILLLWVLGGLSALAGALCYAELGAGRPRSGGEYLLLTQLFHPAVGFLAGWISVVAGFAGPIAAAALAFSAYFGKLWPPAAQAPTTVALADGGGILGGATGLVTTRAFTRDPDMLLVGSIVGATSGFLAGGLVGRQLRLSGRTRNIALRLPDGLRVAVVPSGAGATLQVSGW